MAEKGPLIRPLSLATFEKIPGQAEDRREFFLCSPPRDPHFFQFFHKDFFRLALRNGVSGSGPIFPSSPQKIQKSAKKCPILPFFSLFLVLARFGTFSRSGHFFDLLEPLFSQKTRQNCFFQNFQKKPVFHQIFIKIFIKIYSICWLVLAVGSLANPTNRSCEQSLLSKHVRIVR